MRHFRDLLKHVDICFEPTQVALVIQLCERHDVGVEAYDTHGVFRLHPLLVGGEAKGSVHTQFQYACHEHTGPSLKDVTGVVQCVMPTLLLLAIDANLFVGHRRADANTTSTQDTGGTWDRSAAKSDPEALWGLVRFMALVRQI